MAGDTLQAKVADEQIRLICTRILKGIPVSLVTAGLLVYILSVDISLLSLIFWWCLLAVMVVIRFVMSRLYARNPKRFTATKWRQYLTVTALCSGLVWGIGALWMVQHVSLANQLTILLILVGMGASGSTNLIYLLSAFTAYLMMMFIPVSTWFIVHYDDPHINAGMIGFFFMFTLWLVMHWSYRAALESMQLRFRNTELLAQLATSNSELAEANQALLAQSNRDHLTQVANRRYFDEVLDREWRRANRSQHQIGLLMIDIDYFKGYNDTYGHQEGDTCLQKVVDAISHEVFRPGDLTARYGGEEFAVILPETPCADIVGLAEKIRLHVEQLAIPHSASEIAGVVTISIGWQVMVPDAKNSLSALVSEADEHLYQAKQNGRNRVYPVLD